MGESTWCYAEEEDSESWRGHCESREAAIAEAPGELEIYDEEGGVFYVAEFTKPRASKYMPKASYIVEMADERCERSDECDSLEASFEAEAELDAFLAAWADKHVHVTFYDPTGRPERIVVPPTDTSCPPQGEP